MDNQLAEGNRSTNGLECLFNILLAQRITAVEGILIRVSREPFVGVDACQKGLSQDGLCFEYVRLFKVIGFKLFISCLGLFRFRLCVVGFFTFLGFSVGLFLFAGLFFGFFLNRGFLCPGLFCGIILSWGFFYRNFLSRAFFRGVFLNRSLYCGAFLCR